MLSLFVYNRNKKNAVHLNERCVGYIKSTDKQQLIRLWSFVNPAESTACFFMCIDKCYDGPFLVLSHIAGKILEIQEIS